MADVSRIDSLIEAGWNVLESDFDPGAFRTWRMRASQCVAALMGPDHPYTKYFGNFVLKPEPTDLLAGEGILVAIRERVSRRAIEHCTEDRRARAGIKDLRGE
jgi:hypothetical protein